MTLAPFVPAWLPNTPLGIKRGIEKESLRMAKDGHSASTMHPHALGSKLTHPFITTDYCENLIELITPPYDSIEQALTMLEKLHVLVAKQLGDEVLWPLSMPCMLSDTDADIRLADYGTSNIGRLKTLYRLGLGIRYGRKMQTIAGVHYNLSFGDELFLAWQQAQRDNRPLQAFKNDAYLALIRNFKRLIPLVLYLTGASPSVCACFLQGREHHLQPLGTTASTFYAPLATSLRMGKLGYTNSVQDDLGIYYNDLQAYTTALKQAVQTPLATFSALGIDDALGNPMQINDHILQIENEFYSPIRPKQIMQANETPSDALRSRGIAYVELRAIDLDPYASLGIAPATAHFLEALALYCLLSPSPVLLGTEERLLAQNIDAIVNEGRKTGVQIQTSDGSTDFHQWASVQLQHIRPFGEILDQQYQTQAYTAAVDDMQNLLDDSNKTPAARIIADSIALGGTWQLGEQLGQHYKQQMQAAKLSASDESYFTDLAAQSWQEQARLEASDQLTFAEFLAPYRQTSDKCHD